MRREHAGCGADQYRVHSIAWLDIDMYSAMGGMATIHGHVAGACSPSAVRTLWVWVRGAEDPQPGWRLGWGS